MGRQKLLLKVGGRTIIDRVLEAWVASHVDDVVVVVRTDDLPLAERCRAHGVHVVTTTESPAEMRQTLEIGLWYVAQMLAPRPADAWMVAPADMPAIQSSTINRVLSAYDPHSPGIVVPRVAGRRGHPVLLPWSEVAALRCLHPNEGLDVLIRRQAARTVDVDDSGVILDVDTPVDLRQLRDKDAN